jgi:hypothetical protein
MSPDDHYQQSGYSTLGPAAPKPRAPEFRIGLDLGTLEDYSALAVVELPPGHTPGESLYRLTHLERWRIPYPDLVRVVGSALHSPPLAGHHQLVVDSTGVGVAVWQMLGRAGIESTSLTITGGTEVGSTALGLSVPKGELIGAMQCVLQTHRLKVAPGLPLGKVLAAEMAEFVRRTNPVTGHNQFASWREGSHDDCVLAVSMAIWVAEYFAPIRFY